LRHEERDIPAVAKATAAEVERDLRARWLWDAAVPPDFIQRLWRGNGIAFGEANPPGATDVFMSLKTQGGTRPPGALALGCGCAAGLLDSAFGEEWHRLRRSRST